MPEFKTYSHSLKPWYKLAQPIEAKAANNDVVIIGAGIAGCSIAWHLAKYGAKVTIIERNPMIANEASGNPLAIMMPLLLPQNEILANLYWQCYQYAISHYLSIDSNLISRSKGILQLFPESSQGSWLRKSQLPNWVTDEAIGVDNHQASDISGIKLASAGHYFANGLVLNPQQLCYHYLSQYPNSINLINNANAIQIIKNPNDSNWEIIDKNGNIISKSTNLVIANAYDALPFKQTSWLPLQKIRGQVTYLSASEMTTKLRVGLHYQGYITPSFNGFHVVGASFQINENSQLLMDRDHQENLERLSSIINLSDFGISLFSGIKNGKVGFRTALPDRRPCIGPIPNIEFYQHEYADLAYGRFDHNYPNAEYEQGLYIMVGLGSRGLLTAPFGANYLAKLIMGSKLELEYGPSISSLIHPARFIIKALTTSNL